MAKTSSIEKNNKRRRMALAQAPKRKRLKELAKDRTKTPEERFAARLKLAEMPRNGSKVRVRNRCEVTGRPRGTYRKL
jgi:small subunit ribosomal protein S14